MVSCSRFDPGWRTKLDLGGSEPFDDLHGAATLTTAIKIRGIFGGGGVMFRLWLWSGAQRLKAKWQKSGAPTVGQEAEVADAHEAFRKDVQ